MVRQPGGRVPAPGQLALVQAFINTHYDLELEHGAEVLGSPEALASWLARHGLLAGRAPLGAGALAAALELREALRELARDGTGQDRLNQLAVGAGVEVRFSPAGPEFVGSGLGQLLVITATAMLDGSWYRLKVCPGEGCGWAFYDHSRNQAGRWCSMSVCGGRAKAKAHYRRRRAYR